MLKNLIIVGLLTINLVFGVALLQRNPAEVSLPVANPTIPDANRLERSSSEAPLSVFGSHPRRPMAADLTLDTPLPDLINDLRQAGLDESLVRQLALAAMHYEHEARLASRSNTPYWQKPEASAVDLINRRIDWQAEQRLVLIDLFGDEVASDPLFADLFRPLNNSLPFLDSDKQIALHELQTRQDALNRQTMRGGMTRESREELMQRREDFDTSISAILTPDERFEYDLRESRAADFLRQGMAEFDYSEQDFREIFAIRQDTAQTLQGERRSDTREVLEQRLEDYLGTERFDEYQRSQDPAFRSLKQIGERYGNTDAQVVAMFEETQQAQTRLREVFQDGNISREDRRARTEKIWNETIDRIETVAGEDTAASVKANSAQLGLAPRSRTPGRPPFNRGGP